jgi:rod shape-determining protein MreC
MRNIFVFIRTYFNLLFFLVLQIVSLIFLVRYNKSHEAAYSNIANEVTGRINLQYNKIQYYFHLKETNKQLAEENAKLRNVLASNFEGPDTARQNVSDSLTKDTTGKYRKFVWLPAKVVGNTVSSQMNYLTLHRGSAQGVKRDMAVIGPNGVVGLVVDVSENFCRVMSLLNRNSKVSSMLLRGDVAGSVTWDGEDPQFLTLKNIPKSAKVVKGDTVVTSNYSANFPSNLHVGYVQSITAATSSNFYTIKIRAATNFYSIQYVNLVENVQWEEQRRLEAAPVKNQ